MLDTNVLILALGQHQNKLEIAACRELWDALVARSRDIFIAAPTLAEFIRGNPTVPVPMVKGVQIVSFDRQAAQLLGTALPATVIKQVSDATGTKKDYLKYDALILACAARWQVDCLVSFDTDMQRLRAQDQTGALRRLQVVNPFFFQLQPVAPQPFHPGAQQPLPPVAPQPSPQSPGQPSPQPFPWPPLTPKGK
ncbi:PIN domain-containing protein [Archangium sp.]|uniref:type II toxin-antitoxin system VapC family toxin n=1 Tax=Archangium sp. TaxID=1872627 RepID=UPI00286CEDB8|nr:PIN domain-containing protein [Archangium sp.]